MKIARRLARSRKVEPRVSILSKTYHCWISEENTSVVDVLSPLGNRSRFGPSYVLLYLLTSRFLRSNKKERRSRSNDRCYLIRIAADRKDRWNFSCRLNREKSRHVSNIISAISTSKIFVSWGRYSIREKLETFQEFTDPRKELGILYGLRKFPRHSYKRKETLMCISIGKYSDKCLT